MFELKPYRSSQKSYYGKAKVETVSRDNHVVGYVLYSYDTPVCAIDCFGCFTRLWDSYSATTMKHINSFIGCVYPTHPSLGKKAWEAMPVDETLEIW